MGSISREQYLKNKHKYMPGSKEACALYDAAYCSRQKEVKKLSTKRGWNHNKASEYITTHGW